jgi:hypothetical protein
MSLYDYQDLDLTRNQTHGSSHNKDNLFTRNTSQAHFLSEKQCGSFFLDLLVLCQILSIFFKFLIVVDDDDVSPV